MAKDLEDEKFRRLTRIKRSVFNKIIFVLEEANKNKKVKGRKNKLSLENILLMTSEYLREYRIYFHISQSFGISESSAYKNINASFQEVNFIANN